jgi:hypothetical protein
MRGKEGLARLGLKSGILSNLHVLCSLSDFVVQSRDLAGD